MEYLFSEDKIIIKNPQDFSLLSTFDCGQCFRFNEENGHFFGVSNGKVAEFYEEVGDIIVENVTKDEFLNYWVHFLDLERDYKKIKKELIKDKVIKEAIEFGGGIRILNQDFFECLISFIISQQNNIPKIKKAVEHLCLLFGEEIIYKGKSYYTFPTCERLKDIDETDLAPLKIGYRDKYIIDAIFNVYSGNITYEKLINLPYLDAKRELLKIKGVGDKVADCVLLFSLLKSEAFPVDTWIKKAMEGLYNLKPKEIHDYTELNFGKYSGFAQQYIFYYVRALQGDKLKR